MRRPSITLVAGLLAGLLVGAIVPAAFASLHGTASGGDCARSQLDVRPNGSQGAAGTIRGAWVFTNRSKSACTLDGYPDWQLFRKGGRPFATTTKKNLAPAPAHVTLTPGDSGTFFSQYSDVPSGTKRGRISRVAEMTAPSAGAGLFIPAALEACGGVIHVSGVEAGVHGP